MNIGEVIPWFPSFASGETISAIFTYRELKRLVDRGNEVVVITVQRAGMPAFEVMDGIVVYRFPSHPIPKIRYDMPHFIRLNRLISSVSNDHKLDLVVFFSSDFLTSIPSLYIKKKIDLPTVVVVNGLPGISWFTGDGVVDRFGWVYTNLIGKRIIKSADGLRLLYGSLYDDLSKFNIDGNRMRVIHGGVDTDIFNPRYDKSEVRTELGLKEEDFFILYVGRLVKPIEMKGTGYMIEAVKDLVPKYRNLKLVLVGDGDGREKNEELAKSISSNVIFTGYRSDVYRFMSAADVLVLPSLCEGCPNVVLEACACGAPVVASRVGAVPELIENGKTGIIVSPGSIIEIKQALTQLIENPSLGRTMGGKARERMEKQFTLDTICEKLEGFYQETMKTYEDEESMKAMYVASADRR
jgi:glycosyltransferase involved in cell wall biosynthesis